MSRKFIFLSLLSFSFLTGTAQAQNNDQWGPNVTFGAKIGNHRDLGEVELFAPIAQDDNSLLYADIRYRTDPGSEWEGNAGIGFRTITDQDLIWGVYGFADYRESPADNKFRQITVGTEILTENWDARANAYIPERGKQSAGQNASVSVAGNQVFVENSQTYEKAMPGIDAEIGYKLPIDNTDIRVFGGGYHFWDDDLEDITGVRGRVEWSIDGISFLGEDTALRFSAETQHDNVRDDNHFIGAEISIPLYKVPKRQNLSPIKKRMTNPIVRDIDVVTSSSTTTAPPQAAQTVVNGKTVSNVYVITEEDTAAFQAELAGLPSDAMIIVNTANPVVIDNTIALKANQSIVGSAASVSVRAGKGPMVNYTANAAGNSVLTRSNGLYGASQPIFSLAGNGNHLIQDIVLNNENGTFGGTQMMISNAGNTPTSLSINNIDSDSGLQVDITAGSSSVSINNSRIHGIDLRTRNTASMTASITNNTIDRMSNVAVVFPQNITSSLFVEAMNSSTMVITDVSNNIIRDQFAKIGGRVDLGAGFVNSSATPMEITRMTGNTISRTDGLGWGAGTVLGQGTGGDILYFREFHGNSDPNNQLFESVGSQVNIGKAGFSADIAGLLAANPGMTFTDYGGSAITNTLP